jgi:hypothetical protein
MWDFNVLFPIEAGAADVSWFQPDLTISSPLFAQV